MKTKRKIRVTSVFILASLSFIGCTKERAFEEVYKDSVYDSGVKQGITSTEFIYVPSQLDSPHSTNGTMPGAMGQERIVRFRFTEKELLAETVIEDERFKDKTLNSKPVIAIPVSHVDYRCADNGVGECSNREEEVNDVDWKLKRSFKPTVEGMQVADANTLPIELDKLLGENCHSLLGSRVIGADFKADAVHIEIEKTFRSNVECLTELDSLSDLTFNVRQIHSFVKRENLVSKNYETVSYPQTDENTFGFFTTESHRLSVDYAKEEKGEKVLMNRWNPKRKVLPYKLSANFFKPENAAIKEATLESVAAVNTALKEAKVDLQIEVSDQVDSNMGDIRNSMIVMIEDPQANGVLGYGPSIADPRTGEIISARVVMYSGTMRSQLSHAWNEFVEEETKKSTLIQTEKPTEIPTLKIGKKAEESSNATSKEELNRVVESLRPQFDLEAVLSEARSSGEVMTGSERMGPFVTVNAKTIAKFEKELLRMRERFPIEGKILDQEDPAARKLEQAKTLAKYNYFPVEMVNMTGAVKLASLEGLKDMPRKVWSELSESEQEKIVSVMLPFIWVPTLVHEIGHNLGLRHNFAGSEDKANFYTREEIEKHGHNHPMEYSSIMDYSYKTLNELRVMGKYDIAALRFAYNREVEKKDGTVVKLKGTLESLGETETAELKEFKFCTDGNVGVNAGCRRFDEGTTLTEIAQNLLQAHDEYYKRRNLRNGRRNFSITNDGAYVQRIANLYMDMRQFFEVYDMVQSRFGIPENHPIWTQNEFLKDVKSAVLVSRKAMMDPALVPSKHCVAQNEAGDIEAVPMEVLGGVYGSCFHPDIVSTVENAGFKVIAQFGKQFTSEKYASSTNPYADQIDVRGYWADKLLGPVFLTARRLGVSTFDKYTGNFMDRVGGTAVQMIQLIDSYLLNKVTAPVVAELEDGSPVKIESFKFEPNSTHQIPALSSRGLRAALKLPNHEVSFAQALLTNVLSEMWDTRPSALTRTMRNYYGIHVEPKIGDSVSQYHVVEVDGKRFFIHKTENRFAIGAFNQLGIVRTLDKVKPNRLEIVLSEAKKAEEEKSKGQALDPVVNPEPTPTPVPVVLTPDEKAAVALGSKVIEAYMKDEFPSAATLEGALLTLGEVNKIVTF